MRGKRGKCWSGRRREEPEDERTGSLLEEEREEAGGSMDGKSVDRSCREDILFDERDSTRDKREMK